MEPIFRSAFGRLVADVLLEDDRFVTSLPRIRHEGVERPSLAGYPIIGKLGQGGGGTVYLGMHVRLERPVAIKIVHETLLVGNVKARERFLREARLAGKVSNPHVVGILDVNELNGLPYLIMEYVNGRSAHGHMWARAAQGGVPEAEALDICIAATEGLAAAHAQDVVHRDVKPDNILIPYARQASDVKAEAHGTPGDACAAPLAFADAKLTDLGLARVAGHGETITESSMALGTPGFMAPEQIRDARTARKPADVFGMGAALYALLAAHAPWRGPTPTDTALMTIKEPPSPLEGFRPDVSEGTRKLIARCLEKDPERRPKDGADLLAALLVCRAALGAPAAAPGPGSGKTPGKAPPTIPAPVPATVPAAAPAAAAKANLVNARKPEPVVAPPSGNSIVAPADESRLSSGLRLFFCLCGAALGVWVLYTYVTDHLYGLVKFFDGLQSGLGSTLKLVLYAVGAMMSAGLANIAYGILRIAVRGVPLKALLATSGVLGILVMAVLAYLYGSLQRGGPGLDLGGGVKLELARVPAGKFMMGAPEAVGGYLEDEVPQHEVTISKAFYMGRYEVTQGQYEAVMGVNPGLSRGPACPVESVSWEDAQDFCRKLSAKTGRTVRLPTEAEWEYACRAGTTTWFYSGNDSAGVGAVAWYCDNSGEKAHPVGQKRPNAFGLYDMHGNVWEWCQDWYGPYSKEAVTDPQGALKQDARVMRGGCASLGSLFCHSAYRQWQGPQDRKPFNGFRVVVEDAGGHDREDGAKTQAGSGAEDDFQVKMMKKCGPAIFLVAHRATQSLHLANGTVIPNATDVVNLPSGESVSYGDLSYSLRVDAVRELLGR